MQGSYLGPEYSDAQIEQQLQSMQLPYQQYAEPELYPQVADLLAQGKVVGWFQGRMEFGPRALGNRSILGDPRSPQMQSVLNLKIKNRESFRPFAPAVLQEMASRYFQLIGTSPYMLLCCQLRQELLLPDANLHSSATGFARLHQPRSTLPAITHVDLSARVQTVSQQTNPRFHQLLRAFYQQAGVAMLINTSFNVRGEPPVCSPKDAIEGFLATDMDILVLGNYVLHKTAQPQAAIEQARQRQFADD
jgi:carbamoyltransferase